MGRWYPRLAARGASRRLLGALRMLPSAGSGLVERPLRTTRPLANRRPREQSQERQGAAAVFAVDCLVEGKVEVAEGDVGCHSRFRPFADACYRSLKVAGSAGQHVRAGRAMVAIPHPSVHYKDSALPAMMTRPEHESRGMRKVRMVEMNSDVPSAMYTARQAGQSLGLDTELVDSGNEVSATFATPETLSWSLSNSQFLTVLTCNSALKPL
ncbi:unnamed protein product, partial [Symbiodinium sp. KB8]